MAETNVFASILSGLGQLDQATKGWYQLGQEDLKQKEQTRQFNENKQLRMQELAQAAAQFARSANLEEAKFGEVNRQTGLLERQFTEAAKSAIETNRMAFRELQRANPATKGFEDAIKKAQGMKFEDIYNVSGEGVSSITNPEMNLEIKRYATHLGDLKAKDLQNIENQRFSMILSSLANQNNAVPSGGLSDQTVSQTTLGQERFTPVTLQIIRPYNIPGRTMEDINKGIYSRTGQATPTEGKMGYEQTELPITSKTQFEALQKTGMFENLGEGVYGLREPLSKERFKGVEQYILNPYGKSEDKKVDYLKRFGIGGK
jgi:hypothetical protein